MDELLSCGWMDTVEEFLEEPSYTWLQSLRDQYIRCILQPELNSQIRASPISNAALDAEKDLR